MTWALLAGPWPWLSAPEGSGGDCWKLSGKLIIYCKIHGLGSIERSPGVPPRPGKVNNVL